MISRLVEACPACAAPSKPRAQNPAAPFCSPACKLADLGRWLDGAYKVSSPAFDVDAEVRPAERE